MELSLGAVCWWMLLVILASSTSTVGFKTLTFEFYETEYPTFITNVCDELSGSGRTCQIQTLPKTPAKDGEYLWLKLKTERKEVKLVIKVEDGYILGYEDTFNGKFRANLLKDPKETIPAKTLFPDATLMVSFPFTGGYTELERAGTTRREIELTLEGLHGDIEGIAGQSTVQINLAANFFLSAIQFVSESARFKFIEKAIENQAITPDFRSSRLIAYENKWTDISEAVHSAAASEMKCGNFKKPITVNGKKLEKVNDVVEDMGLLKAEKDEKVESRDSIKDKNFEVVEEAGND